MRGEGVLASTWWFWKVCVGPGVWNAGRARVDVEEDIYLYILLRMHRKSQLNPLNFVIPLV
jgi:hypothetical protein